MDRLTGQRRLHAATPRARRRGVRRCRLAPKPTRARAIYIPRALVCSHVADVDLVTQLERLGEVAAVQLRLAVAFGREPASSSSAGRGLVSGMGWEKRMCVWLGSSFEPRATRRGISLYPSPNFILAGYAVPPARLRLSATMTESAPMRGRAAEQRRRQWSTCAELGGGVPALAFLACG